MAPLRDWMSRALCTQRLWPDAWYPDSRTEEIVTRAQAICRACPVRRDCESAGKPEVWGIWAGEFHSEETAKKIKPPKAVSAFGSMRRMQALFALGWTGKDVSTDIRRYTGLTLSPRRLDQVRNGEERSIPAEVRDAITRAYRRLGSSVGSGNSATNAILFAKEQGWKTPREWRGYDIDDPSVVLDLPEESPGE